MKHINPYNFVPLDSTPPDRSTGYPGLLRWQENTYAGRLTCTLTTLGPAVTLDQRAPGKYPLGNGSSIKVFKFLRNSKGVPIFQGASLKGMIRTVYEALTNSCMPAAATSGKSSSRGRPATYQYAPIGLHSRLHCDDMGQLCPACRLFGITEGDKIHCQGRVAFGDAVLEKGALERSKKVFLKELSGPKPHHYPTYAGGAYSNRGKGSVIAGRKFFYHHRQPPQCAVPKPKSWRSIAVDEYAPGGVEFVFQVYLVGLTPDEVGDLLLAIELAEGLGHKIGVGKAIGLGSCTIRVVREKSFIADSAGLYGSYSPNGEENWYALKKNSARLPPRLGKILKLNKHTDGMIGYPDGRIGYPNNPIDENGVFVDLE